MRYDHLAAARPYKVVSEFCSTQAGALARAEAIVLRVPGLHSHGPAGVRERHTNVDVDRWVDMFRGATVRSPGSRTRRLHGAHTV
jgi:hypothetical protein